MSLKDKPVRPGEYPNPLAVVPEDSKEVDVAEDHQPNGDAHEVSEVNDVDEQNDPNDGKSEPPKDSVDSKDAKDSKDKDKKRKDKEHKEHKDKESKKTAHKLSSLNAQLVAHGYTKRALKLEGLSSSEQAAVSSVISDLLGASSAKVSALEDVNARLRTLQYEHDRLQKYIEKNDREMARLETDVQAAKALTARAEQRQAEEEAKVKLLREDVARGRKALDNMKVAATQEAKRAQIKLDKVLGQLARQVPAVPPTFELINPVAPGHIAPVAAGPIPLIEESLAEFASLRQSLQEEIEAFRHVAVSTANALAEALAAGTGADSPARMLADDFYAAQHTSKHIRQLASWTAHPAIADARLKALVADVRAALTAGVSPVMRDGSGATEAEAEMAEEAKRAQRAREREMADLHERVKDLEVELQIAAAKNEEANKVVEQMAKLSVQGGVPSTTDFADSRLRDELVRQKRLLDAERESLRDRGVRLAEERMALDADRAAFAADRDAAIAAAVAEAQEKARAEAEAEAQAQAQAQANANGKAEAEAEAMARSQPPAKGKAHAHALSPPRKHRHNAHNPPSPSPLSPHKRTPAKPHAHHVAARRRPPRTPLSRLVLERAVLDRDRRKLSSGSASSSGSSSGGSGGGSGGGLRGSLGAKLAASRGTKAGPSSSSAPPTSAASSSSAPAGPSAAPEARPSTSPVLAESARDNVGDSARDKGKGKARASDSAPDREEVKDTQKAPGLRKSSLFASTAASAARAKADKVMSGGARPVQGQQGKAAPAARAWR